MHRAKLEELRHTVSKYLQIPQDFVIVTAIEATNSILVTFMIPEGYSNILLDINDAEKSHLASKGIDEISVNGTTIACNVEIVDGGVEERGISRDNEVKRLLDSAEKDKKEIENLQSLLVDGESQIRICKTKVAELESKLRWKSFEISCCLIQQYVETKFTPKELSLKGIALKNAYNYFRHTLKKAEELGYDKNLLHYLIEANTLFTNSQRTSYHGIIVSQQQSQIQGLQHDLIMAWQEYDRLALLLTGYPKQANIQFPVVDAGIIPGGIIVESIKQGLETIFRKMENELSSSERDTIIKEFFKSKANLKLLKDSKQSLFAFLWSKEVQTKGPFRADIFEFLQNIAFAIKRKDLFDKWSHIFLEVFPGLPQKKSRADHTSDRKQEAKISSDMKDTTPKTSEKSQIDEMADRLKRIEEILDKNVQRMSLSSEFNGAPFSFASPKHDRDSRYDLKNLLKSKLSGAIP